MADSEFDPIDMMEPSEIESLARKHARRIYLEIITLPAAKLLTFKGLLPLLAALEGGIGIRAFSVAPNPAKGGTLSLLESYDMPPKALPPPVEGNNTDDVHTM